jgi:CDGSH-type Zn-finger protein
MDVTSIIEFVKAKFNNADFLTGLILGLCVIFLMPNPTKEGRVNTKIKLDCEKCVDSVDVEIVDIEDINAKKSMCRCWKSKKFPYCDGAHVKHNKETGDNVGPLIIKNKESQ